MMHCSQSITGYYIIHLLQSSLGLGVKWWLLIILTLDFITLKFTYVASIERQANLRCALQRGLSNSLSYSRCSLCLEITLNGLCTFRFVEKKSNWVRQVETDNCLVCRTSFHWTTGIQNRQNCAILFVTKH